MGGDRWWIHCFVVFVGYVNASTARRPVRSHVGAEPRIDLAGGLADWRMNCEL